MVNAVAMALHPEGPDFSWADEHRQRRDPRRGGLGEAVAAFNPTERISRQTIIRLRP
jgi:hypothetical protein